MLLFLLMDFVWSVLKYIWIFQIERHVIIIIVRIWWVIVSVLWYFSESFCFECHREYHRYILASIVLFSWVYQANRCCIEYIILKIMMILEEYLWESIYDLWWFHWIAFMTFYYSGRIIFIIWFLQAFCIYTCYIWVVRDVYYWRLQSCSWILLRRCSLSFRFDECFSIIWAWHSS